MAGFLKKLKQWWESPLGRFLQVLLYILMLSLILIFFDGQGEFIYEGF